MVRKLQVCPTPQIVLLLKINSKVKPREMGGRGLIIAIYILKEIYQLIATNSLYVDLIQTYKLKTEST